jgi:hypothetical protein
MPREDTLPPILTFPLQGGRNSDVTRGYLKKTTCYSVSQFPSPATGEGQDRGDGRGRITT